MTAAYIIAARRSPVMPAGGAFSRLLPHELARPVIAALLAETGVAPGRIGEVIVANALGGGGNPARLVALAAGLPEHVAGLSLDRQCAGGLDAMLLARAMVESGAAEIVLAGGVESYSRRPLRLRTDPDGGPATAYDAPPFSPWPDRDPDMHVAADALGRRLGISRAAQDEFAVASHAKARAAMHTEITPVEGQDRDGFTRALTPAIAARAPAICGTVSAANAAIAADGAGFALIASERVARGYARPMRIVAGATLGAAPEWPGLAPLAAIDRCMAGRQISDIRHAEVMEAYAVQAIACVDGAGLDPAIVNPGGGALARGHPVGASGAVLVARLFAGLTGGFGLATIAAAGGIGTALLVER